MLCAVWPLPPKFEAAAQAGTKIIQVAVFPVAFGAAFQESAHTFRQTGDNACRGVDAGCLPVNCSQIENTGFIIPSAGDPLDRIEAVEDDQIRFAKDFAFGDGAGEVAAKALMTFRQNAFCLIGRQNGATKSRCEVA